MLLAAPSRWPRGRSRSSIVNRVSFPRTSTDTRVPRLRSSCNTMARLPDLFSRSSMLTAGAPPGRGLGESRGHSRAACPPVSAQSRRKTSASQAAISGGAHRMGTTGWAYGWWALDQPRKDSYAVSGTNEGAIPDASGGHSISTADPARAPRGFAPKRVAPANGRGSTRLPKNCRVDRGT